MSNRLNIIFMGTPEFAVESLKILVENNINIVGVVTAPDKPKGRGKKLGVSAVKEYAVTQNLKIMQPTNLKDPEFYNELMALQPDLMVVVAFRMLPEKIWSAPKIGTFNLHASLLPAYRGAAPINWAIMNGESETGVTTFFLKHQIDTGAIIFQEKEPIHPEDNVGTLYERLMQKGAKLVLKTVEAVTQGGYSTTPQEELSEPKHAPKIFKETCEINWEQPTKDVHNFVRGLSPYPAAWTTLAGKNLKVYATKISTTDGKYSTGTFYSDNKNFLKVNTLDGALEILELQLEGKKRMNVKDFLLGNKIEA